MTIKKIYNILIFLMFCMVANATHNRAGQITFRHISGLTYEFTLTTFTYVFSPADREYMEIYWGDNTYSRVARCNPGCGSNCDDYARTPNPGEILTNEDPTYRKNIYKACHEFPGHGTYFIQAWDANRNLGIENIPNSVGVIFGLQTIFRINPNVGHNNSPELRNYPIDKAAVGRRYVHNPSAVDADGDSLSYELAICLRENGIEIESYRHPETTNGPDSLYVHPTSGDFVWDAPTKAGYFNVAMRINEWRYGVKINSITRDMQIEVVDSKNKPPVFPTLKDTCVIAGEKISITFDVTDPDDDFIVVTASGAPFEVFDSPAEFSEISSEEGKTTVTFTWQTTYTHVRNQRYTVVFKAEDQNDEVKLVSFANYNITVIAPAVENFPAIAEKKEILLEWKKTECEHAAGYEIYRSIGSYDLELNPCETGIPSRYDYEKVGVVNGINNTKYNDNNNNMGLSPGIEYCYRIVSFFQDGAKSLPSEEYCASLLAGSPPLIRASVVNIDDKDGEIRVEWLEKPNIEKIKDKTGPIDNRFQYRLFYSEERDNFPTQTLYTSFFGNNDTVYLHKSNDTKNKFPHYYKVELWDTNDNTIIDEDFEIASTFYPILQESDKSVIITFGRYTPWVNNKYDIYRCECSGTDICIPEISPAYLIGDTNRETFIDNNEVKNGQRYCYRIVSAGYRFIDGVRYENDNWSHVACATPYDNVPPCTPELTGETFCDENRSNQLKWKFDNSCMYDVEKFIVYFSYNGDDLEEIAVIERDKSNPDADEYSYTDYGDNNFGLRVGYYYVTAVDSTGNESQKKLYNYFATPCSQYELPNVFTPNGDGINDIFKSFYPKDGILRTVNMQIFNRTGKIVFKTNDPDINWDGRDIDSKRFVSPGVYYYICELHEDWPLPTGPSITPFTGIIHVYTGKDAKPFDN